MRRSTAKIHQEGKRHWAAGSSQNASCPLSQLFDGNKTYDTVMLFMLFEVRTIRFVQLNKRSCLCHHTMTRGFCSVAVTILFPVVINALLKRAHGFDRCQECYSSKKKHYGRVDGFFTSKWKPHTVYNP